MDYVKKFLNVEGVIGQGAFGRVLIASQLEDKTNGGSAIGSNNAATGAGITAITTLTTNNNLSNSNLNTCTNTGQIAQTSQNRFALKCVHPILRPRRLADELRHLRDLGGQCNVVQMHTAHFHMGSLYIVMELIEHDRFLDIVSQLNYSEIVIYIKNLLIALRHVHEKDIMHRDIKPANFLYNRKNKKFLLVDFGLAQKVRNKPLALFPSNNRPIPGTAPTNYASSISLLGSPTTPTLPKRHIAPLFPELCDRRKDNTSRYHHHHNGYQSNQQNITSITANPAINNTINNNNGLSSKPNIPFVNLKSTHILNQSSARHYINITPNGSPSTPNVSTKRQLSAQTNPNDFNQMLKKLRVSNDEIREPVKLTVGAYESPVTNNDGTHKRNLNHKFSTPTIPSKQTPKAKCDCRGKPKTCSTCMSRPESNAPKSGTPGFKAPEVLLRYPYQTTAIDIWSAGVIFACLLSGHSPFFRDVGDDVALAEIITIFGSQKVIQAARDGLDIRLKVEPRREPVDLVKLCKTIRSNNKDKRQIEIPSEAFDLLLRMLDPNPKTRITAKTALEHPIFSGV